MMLDKIQMLSMSKTWLTAFLTGLRPQRMFRSILRDLRFSDVINGFAVCGAALHQVFLLQAAKLDRAKSSETEVDTYNMAEELISRARLVLSLGAVLSLGISVAQAQSSQVERGKYLVNFGGCNDCHTPGYFLGKPDPKRYLGGSDVGFLMPGLGAFVGPNLTPDKQTGLGNWSKQQIVTAIRTGVRPDGRVLAPVMPWRTFAGLTNNDANAIADYLRSLPPVSHKVAGPFGSDEQAPIPLMQVVPPAN